WAWVMPILDNWANSNTPPATYTAGSWGPQQASDLLAELGDKWAEAQNQTEQTQ
ncbi:MAG: hypothetical protein Q4E16_02820, partial [Neisseria sp.]|nr:hypothetical protein [Neisseria sp.]